MVLDIQIVILDQFQPPPLSHIELRLGEKISQALVVSINSAGLTKQVVRELPLLTQDRE